MVETKIAAPRVIMRRSSSIKVMLSAFLVCGISISPGRASNFQLEFAPIDRQEVDRIVPGLITEYPQAAFFVTGLDSPRASWRVIRIEDAKSCEGDLCLTLIVQTKIEWKVLVQARKSVFVTWLFEPDEYIQLNLPTKSANELIIRYTEKNQVIFIQP